MATLCALCAFACPVKFTIMRIAANLTGACPVQFFAEDERSEFNRGGSKKQKRNAQFQPRPHYYNCLDLKKKKCYK
jgi:hypothetical protein